VRRSERAQATDGEIGQVEGLVIDPGNHHVAHVLLQEGHLWGRKQVAIPIGAVTRGDGGIRLNITKRQVQELPPVSIDHPRPGTARRREKSAARPLPMAIHGAPVRH
jgi:PRC-barrel domain